MHLYLYTIIFKAKSVPPTLLFCGFEIYQTPYKLNKMIFEHSFSILTTIILKHPDSNTDTHNYATHSMKIHDM